MFKAISRWFDRVMGLPEGWGLLMALATLVVGLHVLVTVLQVAERLGFLM